MLFKGLVAAALGAALVVPAASATSSPRIDLAIVPVPHKQLGSPARHLTIAQGSGVVSNRDAVSLTFDGTTSTFKKLGRLTGYALNYGDPFTGGSAVTAATTSVEKYRTADDATQGLAFWQKEDALLSGFGDDNFTVTGTLLKVRKFGGATYAYLTSYKAANIAPLTQLDERFTEGQYVLQVSVSAGTVGAARALTAKVVRAFAKRWRLAKTGKLHGNPAKLPWTPAPGPPAGGPDLSAMALEPTDLTGTVKVANKGYIAGSRALSTYNLVLFPAGPFFILGQDIEWYSTANEASFVTDEEIALALSQSGIPYDLSGVGDNAQGAGDSAGDAAIVSFSNGNLAEFVIALAGTTAIKASDVTSVAQAAAGHIDAVLGG